MVYDLSIITESAGILADSCNFVWIDRYKVSTFRISH